jgi:hypothetical protein
MMGRSGAYARSGICAPHWREMPANTRNKSMKKFLYALIAMMSLGAAVANASAFHNKASQQQGDAYNWLEGGGE